MKAMKLTGSESPGEKMLTERTSLPYVAPPGDARLLTVTYAVRARYRQEWIYSLLDAGKETLLTVYVDDIYDELRRLALRTFSSPHLDAYGLRVRVRWFVGSMFYYYAQNHDALTLIIREGNRLHMHGEFDLAQHFRRQHQMLADTLRPFLDAAASKGTLPSSSGGHRATALLAHLHEHLLVTFDTAPEMPPSAPALRAAAWHCTGQLLDLLSQP